MRRRHDAALTWPRDWIDWPDFLLPRDREDAVTRIRAVHERARASHGVEVACVGGVGRTGTVIACLAVLAGVAPELRQRAATDGVHSTALAIDPRNWELVQFTLWEDTAPESAGTRYRVLHLSTPELGELQAGRHW
jgi:hypothetical protein